MARIDWAFVCELAYFDRHERLCVVGIVKEFVVPQLPLALNQVTLVARLTDIQPMDEVDVALGVVAPNGAVATPTAAHGAVVEVSNGYILATLRDVPLLEEGSFGFCVGLHEQPPVIVPVPVMAMSHPLNAECH